MGNLITWIIALPIIAIAVYILVTRIKSGVKGGGCSGCSGCGSADDESCDSVHKH